MSFNLKQKTWLLDLSTQAIFHKENISFLILGDLPGITFFCLPPAPPPPPFSPAKACLTVLRIRVVSLHVRLLLRINTAFFSKPALVVASVC